MAKIVIEESAGKKFISFPLLEKGLKANGTFHKDINIYILMVGDKTLPWELNTNNFMSLVYFSSHFLSSSS